MRNERETLHRRIPAPRASVTAAPGTGRRETTEPPTPEERASAVVALLGSLTRPERERYDAFLRHGTFAGAAAELECDPETVSATCRRVQKRLQRVLFGMPISSDFPEKPRSPAFPASSGSGGPSR